MNILMYNKQFEEPSHFLNQTTLFNIDLKTANVCNSMSKQWINSKQFETLDQHSKQIFMYNLRKLT